MPELPEAERARKLAEQHLAGSRIDRVYAARDPIVFTGTSPRRFAATLKGRKVLAARRRGKHIWLELDKRPWPAFHLGMTGRFHAYQNSPRPNFCKLELQMRCGRRFAFTNVRRLGRIRLLDDPLQSPPMSKLGLDPLLDALVPKKIGGILAKRKAPLKAVLLDQSVFAGVGNWLADETLYQAHLSPHRPACTLNQDAISRICRCLRRIIRKAVSVDADHTRFPRSWLFHYRWGRNSDATLPNGAKIKFTVIAGRTTAWVPKVQR